MFLLSFCLCVCASVGIGYPSICTYCRCTYSRRDYTTLYEYTVKKRFSRPQPGCHFPNSPLPGIIKLSSARESLVSDIPAGDGKIDNLFFTVYNYRVPECLPLRPNWLPPPPLPQVSVSPPGTNWGEDHTRLRVRGRGEPIRTTGKKAWHSVYILYAMYACTL